MKTRVTLVLKLPRDTQVTPEACQVFLSALLDINHHKFHHRLLRKPPKPLALEIVLKQQAIGFQISLHPELIGFVEAQLQAAYPLVTIEPGESIAIPDTFDIARLTLKSGNYYPLKTYRDFHDVDPLSSVLTVLSKAAAEDAVVIQYALATTTSSWQARAERYAAQGTKRADGTYQPRADQTIVREKIRHPGFRVSLRVAASRPSLLTHIIHAYNVFLRPDGNRLAVSRPLPWSKTRRHRRFNARKVSRGHILNVEELATLWHLPSEQVKTPSIVWGAAVLSDPPPHLPVHTSAEAAKSINFFARTAFKNRDRVFGIQDLDRGRHLWVTGKTGTGKSTLLANMVIDDLKKGKGVAVIDPHGDLCEVLLDYIPRRRINDVIYFNPSDTDYPIALNPLQVTRPEEAEWVVSGMISILHKLFGYSWGPRLEYILRNTLLTLVAFPNSTLEDVLKVLTRADFRQRVVDRSTDPVLKNFWTREFDALPDRLREEAIAPILNKVGQFVTSPLLRRIIGRPHSAFSIDAVMNDRRIMLANLAQGRVGEDNAALLGAALITQFQLAAMRRVRQPEADRRDFFLYVDEFQNFATGAFIKILSEARKYHLSLTLANQYAAQIPVDVRKAILGNAGTLMTFAVGAEDARLLHGEFADVFSAQDLVNLANYQIVLRLMVDGQSQRPFLATTLPLPVSGNRQRAKVVRVSRERWGRQPRGGPS